MSAEIRKELNVFRNLVDDTLYGAKQLNEVAKRKFYLEKTDIGKAMAHATRLKIYNDFMDIIYLMRKGDFPKERTLLLEKRIRIHSNQLKKLKEKNYIDNKRGLDTLLQWIKLTQIKQMSIKNPSYIYSKLINL